MGTVSIFPSAEKGVYDDFFLGKDEGDLLYCVLQARRGKVRHARRE